MSRRSLAIPQHMGQFDSWTVAEALRVERKIEALHAILGGSVDVESFTILGDDWGYRGAESFSIGVLGITERET